MGEDEVMTEQLSDEDRTVLERLLTRLAGRLDGAIDFWTLVCLGRVAPDPQGFLQHHSEAVKALVIVIEDLLTATSQSSREEVPTLLGRMRADVRKLQGAFLALEQFRRLELEEIRSATMDIADAYNDLRDSIPRLADALSVSVSCWQSRPPDREAYYQGILHQLFDLFRDERANQSIEVSTPS
jgi:hypothetical protein